jgi:cysteine-S-conjugate beta-lyase
MSGLGPVPGFDDVTDADLRARGNLNWSVAPDDVIPGWVAEMDYAACPPVTHALAELVRVGRFGYPSHSSATRMRSATADFAGRHYGWTVDPSYVVGVADVMDGVALALDVLCDDAPVVVPTPAYPPFLEVVPATGREIVTLPLDPASDRATLDLDRIDDELAAGARTVLLCNPHNPWGRAWTQDELTGLRDVVLAHGARVVSDEIHAPLVLRGARHTPYAALDGTADHVTTLLSASKAFNLPGLKCAQIVAGNPADLRTLTALPLVRNHGLSPLGVEANIAAYTHGDLWLATAVEHLSANRDLFAEQLAERLPLAHSRRLEATYLAWVDLRAYEPERPAAVALERGRLMVRDGSDFGAGGSGHARLNIATSRDRLVEIVRRLGAAFDPSE